MPSVTMPLKAVAKIAKACLRGKGHAYRHGGDEFVFLLPNHTLNEGVAVAERFRAEVSKIPRTSANLTLTVSVGWRAGLSTGGH